MISQKSITIYFILFVIFLSTSLAFYDKCNICENYGLLKKHGIHQKIIDNIIKKQFNFTIENRIKRATDIKFKGHPQTRAETLAIKFNLNTYKGSGSDTGQSISLINLLKQISTKYLNRCPTFILYDKFVEISQGYILQRLFQDFPFTFYHGKINERFELEKKYLLYGGDNSCKSYILFLSDPTQTQNIIGPQMTNKVIVVARSSQWKLRDFLSSESSSKIINLLVISESLTTDPRKERPYVLYTHRLYSDGLGSNVPVVLTSWVKGVLSRPHINLFPQKFTNGLAGHRFFVSAVNQPPFIFRRKYVDGSGTVNIYWEGIEHRLMKLLSSRLNFTFEIIEPIDTDLGSGDAVCHDIQIGRADIGMAGIYITINRLGAVDMSVGHSKDCAAFITLASKALPKYRAIMGPFQWPVWAALTIVYLLGIFPLAYTDRLSLSHIIGNWGELENMFWYVFGTFTNCFSFTGKYSWSTSEKISTRLLIGFYWLFTIIITACYTGSIIAFVTLPAFPDTADSVYDLLGLFFRVGTLDKGGWNTWFNNSVHEATAKLYKKMEFVGSVEEGIGNVTRSFFWNYAFLGSKAQLEYLIQSNFSDDGIGKRSVLHLSEECFALFQIGYVAPKNSVYMQLINDAILKIHQSGLMLKFQNEVSWEMQRTSTGRLLQASSGHALKEIIREERQLTTADTEGMFLLMGIGYTLGALALVSEIIGGFTNKCRQIINRSRRKSTYSNQSVVSSKDNSSGHERTEQDIKEHLGRKAQRLKEHEAAKKRKNRFLGINQMNLTKATLKELYNGYNKKRPTLIVQNNQFIFENEAVSEDSSVTVNDEILKDIKMVSENNQFAWASNENFEFEAMVHHEDQIEEDGHDVIAEENNTNIDIEEGFGEPVYPSVQYQDNRPINILKDSIN